jgi:hypothetical protein
MSKAKIPKQSSIFSRGFQNENDTDAKNTAPAYI